MAQRLAQTQIEAVFSYAGRTKAPIAQPLQERIGGFGGVTGLVGYLRSEKITHVIDATHPFAAQMSANAFGACLELSIPLIRLERGPWVAQPGDQWTHVAQLEDAPAALPDAASRVFLAIGKQHIGLFSAKLQHHYLLRLVDAPDGPLPLPHTHVVVARGPFDLINDTALLKMHGITHIVAKNAGGRGAQAKIDAARALGLAVIITDRPKIPGDAVARTVDEAMQWLRHSTERGV